MEDKDFVRYVSLYRHVVYRVADSYLKNAADSEDIMQDVFLKLYHTNEVFKADENVKAWLIRVTVNACKDYFKSTWQQKKKVLDDTTVTNSVNNNEVISDMEMQEALNTKENHGELLWEPVWQWLYFCSW